MSEQLLLSISQPQGRQDSSIFWDSSTEGQMVLRLTRLFLQRAPRLVHVSIGVRDLCLLIGYDTFTRSCFAQVYGARSTESRYGAEWSPDLYRGRHRPAMKDVL